MSEKSEGLDRARRMETDNQKSAGARSGTGTKKIKLPRATRRNRTSGGGINRSLKGGA